jgi:IS5 family transposase
MATEHEGSAPEQPTTERKAPAQDQVARMIQHLEKRMAMLSDAIVEQSAERAQLRRVFLGWSEFAATATAGFRGNPDIERYLSLSWLAGRGEPSSAESTSVQGDVNVTPSMDEINALLERLDHDIGAERVAMDGLLKRIREPRDSSPGR